MYTVVIFLITLFASSTYVFVHVTNSKISRPEEILLLLFFALLASLFWFITLPCLIIFGGAYLVSKLFTMDWKSKNEYESNSND